MKYAFMTFSCTTLSLAECLDLVKQTGYDGLEPRIQASHAHGIEFDTTPAQRDAIRKQFDDADVPACCIATSCRYADPATVDEHIADTNKAIDLAGDIGSPRLRVFGGKIGEGVSRDDAINNVAEAFKSVADHAASRDVTLCIETHDDWCDPDHVAAIMTKVNHSAIAVNWDIMHPVRAAGKTMDEAYETLRPWIRHVHVHDGKEVDGKNTLMPIGQGIIDHGVALKRLAELGYDGYISGEWINWEPYETHLPRELALLKALEANL